MTNLQIVPELLSWLPNNPDSGAAYHGTIIGRFLGCTTIRPNTILPPGNRYTSPYFNRSAAVNQDITRVHITIYSRIGIN